MANSGVGLFLSQFWRQYHTTGAIWPSGRGLARELAHYVANPIETLASDAPRRLLEVGPGTGTITNEILARLRPHDHLTLVEINPEFVAHLRNRFETEPAWKERAAQTTIETKPIQDFAAEQRFETIVSGLPLNNFSVDTVREILTGLERLAAPRATISFFEYIAIRRVKWLVTSSADRARLRGIDELLHTFFGGREVRRKAICINMPPAWAHHVQIK